ncbi:J domain-containing protein [Sulfurisoma sediminicola]|uniref:DnaJ-like protein n=2 Tax=Sulfurisoma sediminicola TaxID=1381557 RepID=A0A497XAS7_9PROT|nr:J domain-containing protein [Sulfurisoma sediminicola]RLJ63548.1 DnaJ-like protein [Sulfurisoma sediminicola]
MKKTLYDFLGVRRDASPTEIEKAYDRMQTMYAGANGVELDTRDGCSIHLIEEAFATLSNPAKREVYDASLQRAAQRALEARGASTMEPEAASGSRAKVMAALVVATLAFVGWNWKSSHDAQVEKERQTELRRIEAERLAVEAEAARLRAENEKEVLRQAADEQWASRNLQAYAARYGAVRAQADYSELRRQENERRQAEREQQRQEAMERQAREREMNQRQRRDAEDRRYLDQFKPGMSFGK